MYKPARPYSEYNIFFQLEREYILQVELGFRPEYDLTEIFDPVDTISYQGPPLPSKYSHLIYLKDWHLPGKEKRRKRRHRRSHGKIGFHELSLRIAASWKCVDDETRIFCAQLGNLGMQQYKCEMKAYKMLNSHSKTAELSKHDKEVKEKTIEPKLNKIDILTPNVIAGRDLENGVQVSDILSHDLGFVCPERCTLEKADVAADKSITQIIPELDKLASMKTYDFHASSSLEERQQSSVELYGDVMIGESSDGLCFVPTERCTMEDVDAAFDKDILYMFQGLVRL